MRGEIRRIHRELGRSTIYVTHDQDEAVSLADRIVVLQDGRVQQIATPQEVYAQPANIDVARFMGYRNVLDVKVEEARGTGVVVSGDGMWLTGVIKQTLVGARAYAAIRPEEITVGAAGVNLIEGRIENVEYGGRDSLVDVRTASGLVLHARMPGKPAPGDTVQLTVPPDRVLVYPHGSEP
jgi:putative spermidine/putrescine transport system ATP-binding protein